MKTGNQFTFRLGYIKRRPVTFGQRGYNVNNKSDNEVRRAEYVPGK